MERESSISGSLTDLSSLSSEEEGRSISQRKYSSTSYIMKKMDISLPNTKAYLSLSGENESKDLQSGIAGKDQYELPHELSDKQSTSSSLDVGGHSGTIPSIRVTTQDRKATSTTASAPNQSNCPNQSNGQETTPIHLQLNQSDGSNQLNGQEEPVMGIENSSSGAAGHLFTEDEVKSLQQQIANLQADLEQMLQYTHMLVQENNALKNILKDAVIVYDDVNMRQFCDTLLVSAHEHPLLKSGLDYDQLPPIASPSIPPTLNGSSLQPSHSNTSTTLSNETQVSSSKSAPVLPVSTLPPLHGPDASNSHHHQHALKVSAQNDQLTSVKTEPLDPQITRAKGTVKLADGRGVSSSQQAADSIKKLYDLTFTESQKEENQKLLEEKETLKEEEVDCEDKEEAITTPSGPFLSFRKSFKMSPKQHKESRKRCTKSESGSPELPHIGSNSPLRRKTIAGGKMEKPRFYLRDILPVLKEKNELKEQVHLLQDEVASLKSECGRLRAASNTRLNRHSWTEMLVDIPEEVPTLSASPPSDSRPRAITMRMHPAVCDKEPYFTDAVVQDYAQRGLHKAYTIEVTRSDGQRFEIYRRYGEFFTFHHILIQLFPAEVGTYQPKNAVLPSLPSIENVLMKSHLKSMKKYCQTLLARLDSSISRSVFVTNFFTPSQKDRQLPSLTKPRTKSDFQFEMSDYFQMSTTSPAEEEYVLLADYTTDIEGELSLSAGDVVELINRETTGWWLVNLRVKEGESEKIGRVPGDFLKRYDALVSEDQNSSNEDSHDGAVSSEAILGGIAESSMLYVAVEDYKTEDPRQISFSQGAQLVVVEVCEDGWWLAWADGREGWVPASFLTPGDDIPSHWTALSDKKNTGLNYITMAAFTAQNEADLTLPECAVVEVVSKSLTGWWEVRYGGSAGLAPASLLALTDINSPGSEISEEEKMALSTDLSHNVSGFIDPPSRSERYLATLEEHTPN